MRVLVVGSHSQSLLNFRGELLREIVSRGHAVTAVGPDESTETASALREIGVEYRSAPLKRASISPLQDIAYALRLRHIISEVKPDLYLGYTIKPVVYGNIAARLGKVPHRCALITGLGSTFIADGLGRAVLRRGVILLYRLALSGADVVVFQNPDDRAEFLTRQLVKKEKTRVVAGSGVDLRAFESTPIPTDPFVFLLVARLIREKGIGEFVEAARLLRSKYPAVRFQLVGPIDENPSAISEAEVRAWEREGVIEYLGETSDVRPYLRRSTVFVLPSYREGTPRTVLEAMATGRAIITTDVPGCRETVTDGKNGFLVPKGDHVALAESMERFLKNPELLIEMGQASLAMAQTKYDVRLVNSQMITHLGL